MFLHLSLNSFQYASRVLKECRTLSELGWDKSIMVAALWEPGLEHEEQIDGGITVWRVALRTRSWPKNLLVQTFLLFHKRHCLGVQPGITYCYCYHLDGCRQ